MTSNRCNRTIVASAHTQSRRGAKSQRKERIAPARVYTLASMITRGGSMIVWGVPPPGMVGRTLGEGRKRCVNSQLLPVERSTTHRRRSEPYWCRLTPGLTVVVRFVTPSKYRQGLLIPSRVPCVRSTVTGMRFIKPQMAYRHRGCEIDHGSARRRDRCAAYLDSRRFRDVMRRQKASKRRARLQQTPAGRLWLRLTLQGPLP